MIAVLLCAGFATRMYPLTKNFPKSLLPVAGRPVIDYFMDQLLFLTEIHTVYIVTNSKFFARFKIWQENWLKIHDSAELELHIINDGTISNENRLGAIGSLHYAFKNIVTPNKTIVSAGDNIYRFSIGPLWRQFFKSDHHYVIALPETEHSKLKKTGVLDIGQNDRVLKVYEKPQNPPSTWSCPPLYFLQASAWPILDDFVQRDNNRDKLGMFIDFLCRKEKVAAFKLNQSRLDIGDLDSYRKAEQILSSERR